MYVDPNTLDGSGGLGGNITDPQAFQKWLAMNGANKPNEASVGPAQPPPAQDMGEVNPRAAAPPPPGGPTSGFAAMPNPGAYIPSQKFAGAAPPAPPPAVGDPKYDSFAKLQEAGGRGGVQMSDGSWAKMAPGGNSDVVRMKNDPGSMFQKYLAIATGNNPTAMYDPKSRESTMNQYLGLVKEMGQGDRDQLEAQKVSNAREQFYRGLGSDQDRHALAQSEFGLKAAQQEWMHAPARLTDQAKLDAIKMRLQKVSDGKPLDPKEIESINDIVNSAGIRSGGNNVTDMGPVNGTPGAKDTPTTDKPKSVDPMKDLLQDPQLVYELSQIKDPRGKLALIHARKGIPWLNDKWPAVENALKASHPDAADKLKESATQGGFMKAATFLGDVLGSGVSAIGSKIDGQGPNMRQLLTNATNTPMSERLNRMTGSPTAEDELNRYLRFKYERDGRTLGPRPAMGAK